MAGGFRAWETLGRLAHGAADVLLPPRCLGCGAVLADPGGLCPACWETLTFIGRPRCERCGIPFEFETGPGMECAACLADPPAFRRAQAVFLYDDKSRPLVLRFKHADRTAAAPVFAAWMARAGAELLADADLVVPVPLHWLRLLARRYNQAAMLARLLARGAGLPWLPDALERVRHTPLQGRLGRIQRQRNVRGAFRVRRPQAVRGRHVLLIDDVLTSGATVGECARVLLAAGAVAVDVLTLGRVALEHA